MDAAQFESCLESGKFQAEIEKDIQEATGLEIRGTPAFFINGVQVNGAQSASVFEKTIDEQLSLAQTSHTASITSEVADRMRKEP
jgi:predicted DsbA family dithiol-disulfide isomerase